MSEYTDQAKFSHLLGDNLDYLEAMQDETQFSAKGVASRITVGCGVANVKQSVAMSADPNYLVDAYRRYGHIIANANEYKSDDPRWHSDYERLLTPEHYNLTSSTVIDGFGEIKTVGALRDKLQQDYCGSIGFEYMHLSLLNEQQWWADQIEKTDQISDDSLIDLYAYTYRAHALEEYLGIQFPSKKRFSIQGLEPFVGMVNALCEMYAPFGDNVVIGMAHRGRLNTLVNVLGMDLNSALDMFSGAHGYENTSGDVMYHLGFSSTRSFDSQELHLTLCYNPSHLEAVSPITMGMVRARQDHVAKQYKSSALPIIVHGDSAVIGQGVVAESLNMSYTKAYEIAGAIHIVMNNNIGFTTETQDARSSRYCSDIVKMIEMPVMHVNVLDPLAIIKAQKLALAYRMKFEKDVMIVLNGFRKYGHNEADEPAMTQPVLYKKIRESNPIIKHYEASLEHYGLTQSLSLIRKHIDADIANKRSLVPILESRPSVRELMWQDIIAGKNVQLKKMKMPLKSVAEGMLNFNLNQSAITSYNADYYSNLHPQVKKLIEKRWSMAKSERPIDWGMAEILAYNVALSRGYSVRLVGQDVQRGTFSHRHLIVSDDQGHQYAMCNYQSTKGDLYCYNSTLSEYAALGFEYGYSTSSPNTLCIWEAQFGDFANGAQIIIDQFISSAWQKWQRRSGIVLQLPHGYEGQGPEHSSARIERFLQLCAQDNMYVCQPSTPAQMYHLLLRQISSQNRKPLVIFTPKSLLRHPQCVSTINDLENEGFKETMIERVNCIKSKPKVLVMSSGRVSYDLRESIESLGLPVVILRLEQLYPLPADQIRELLSANKQIKEVLWVQDEPENMGPQSYVRDFFSPMLSSKQSFQFFSRPRSASPASGYAVRHKQEQKIILDGVINFIQEVYKK